MGKSFNGILFLFMGCFVVLIIFVSLLGENNKIDTVIDSFFENIQNQQYFLKKDNQNVVKSIDVFDIDGEYSENCLYLELALMEKYSIANASDYKIEIKKSHFWLPFINNSDVYIDVSLKNPEDLKIFSLINKSQKPEFENKLFTVGRKDGRWLITAINIQKSSLFESINRLRKSLNIDSFVSISGTKLNVKPIEIDTKRISNIERRKLNYIFQKLSLLTEASEVTNEAP